MEVIVELFQHFQLVLQSLLGKNQGSDSKVICPWSLPESASWNKSDSSSFEDFQAEHQID